MSALLAALLIGSGVALMAWTIVTRVAVAASDGVEVVAPARRVTAKRRAALVEAAGVVHGSDAELASLARMQTVLMVVLGGLAVLLVATSPSMTTVVAAVPMVMLGWKGPLIIVRNRETKRCAAVDVELVDALGEMVMGVEAGLTLDVVTMRTPTPIVRMFVAALVQNQKLGTPLAGVLRQQASTARRQRRQAVEEKAAKVPMKMIFPTVFCILPVLMIVVVGPAIIRLVAVLP